MKENGKYRILHSCYWMMINVAFGYTTFYLGGYGYSPGEVGVLTAIFSTISVICQPLIGRIADRSSRFHWKTILLLLSAVCGLDLILLTICQAKLLVGILFGVMGLLMNCMMPMINAACFYYEGKGIHVDFGIARGLGSGFYAVASLILGWLTVHIGTSAVPLAGMPVLLALFLTVWFMPYGDDLGKQKGKRDVIENATVKQQTEALQSKEEQSATRQTKMQHSKTQQSDTQKAERSTGFIRKYPAFSVMILASAMIITAHNFMTVYLLQILEEVGGDTGHLGVALAIGAVTEVPILFMASYIVKRCPASKLMIISGISYIAKSAIMLFAGSIGMIYAAHLLQPVSYGLYSSATVYFTDECMRKEDKVTGQSLMTMTMAIGSVAGSLIGGWLIDFGSVTHMMTFGTVLSVAGLGVVIVSAMMHGKVSSVS